MGDELGSWYKRARTWMALGGVLVLLLILFYLAGGFYSKVAPGTVEDPTAIQSPPGARTLKIQVETIRPLIGVVGTIRSKEHVNLSSRINAYVAKINVTAGDEVKRGQGLVELDDRELQERLRAAEADLVRAEAEHRRTLELLRAESATRQQLDVAEASYRSAQAQVEELQVLVSHTRIRSPIDGVVVDRHLEVGDLATVGMVLLTVYDPGRMQLEAPVPLRLTTRLHPGDEVQVTLDSERRTIAGAVTEIVAAVDTQSRTRLVKVSLQGGTESILPGMFGRLLVPGDPRQAILVPEGAVYRVGQLAFVQVQQGDRVMRRAIRLGATHGHRMEILSGVTEGETILLDPVHMEKR